MKIPLSILFALFCFCRSLSASVIFDDAALIPTAFGDYGLVLNKSIPRGQGLFFVTFDAVDDETFRYSRESNTYAIAEAFSIYVAEYGLQFDPNYAASHTPLFTNSGSQGWSLTIPWESTVYLAYWDDRTGPPDSPHPMDNYGWLLLRNTPTGLLIESSVTALGGGILVGSPLQLTAVPEPSTALFGVFTLAIIAYRRSRHLPAAL